MPDEFHSFYYVDSIENTGTLKGSAFSVLLKEEVCVKMDGKNRDRDQVLYSKGEFLTHLKTSTCSSHKEKNR